MKKLYLAAMLLGIAGSVIASELKVSAYRFDEKTVVDAKDPLLLADPGFKKLTDGKFTRKGDRRAAPCVMWRHKDNGRKAPVIRFDFTAPVEISDVSVYYHFGARSHGIKDIKLIGISANGNKLPLGSLTLNHPFFRPEKESAYQTAKIKSMDNSPIVAAEIVFSATGGFLVLEEVLFNGKQLPPPVSAPLQKNPLDKFAAQARPGLRVYFADGQYIMENDFLIYGIDPRYSGSVNYAYDKKAKFNFIMYSAPGTGYGPFCNDRLWPREARDMFKYQNYKAEVITDTPDKKQIRVTGNGISGVFANVTMEKVYTLTKDSPLLQCDWTVTNGIENVTPLKYGFWTYGGVAAAGPYTRIIPGLTAVERVPSANQFVIRDISDGWYGAVSGNNGLAMIVPWERLKEVYYWPETANKGTVECKLGIYPVNAGDSLRFTMFMAPFANVGIPDKINKYGAGGFNLEPEYQTNPDNFSFRYQLFQPGRYTLRISGGILQKNKVSFKKIVEKQLNSNNSTVSFTALNGKGTQVYRAEMLLDSKVVFSADASTVIGNTSGMYLLPLPGEKIPDADPAGNKLELNFNSLEHKSKHINWGKPSANGKLKVLAINYHTGGILDMKEIAQRLDIELTTNLVSGLWSLSGHTMSLNEQSCINELSKKLRNKYDLIIVSRNMFDKIGKANAAQILEQVKNGTGLLLVEPVKLPKELSSMIQENKNNVTASAKKWNGNFYGIAAESLPDTKVRSYSKFGKVFAKAGDLPLAGMFNYGKGTVVALSYLAEPQSRPGSKYYTQYASFFLPNMSSLSSLPEYDYHEYQIAFFGKMMMLAANRKANLEIDTLSAENGKISIPIYSTDKLPVEISVSIRNKNSIVEQQISRKINLSAGKSDIKLTFAPVTENGRHFADVIIKSSKGVEWYGTAVFNNTAQSKITAVNFENRIYRKNENLKVNAETSDNSPVKIQLFDTEGNVFAETSGNSCSLPLADCRTPALKMVVTLYKNGKINDRTSKWIELFQAPDPDRFNITIGWPCIAHHSQAAFAGIYIEKMKDFGVNCMSASQSTLEPEVIQNQYRKHGITYLSSAVYAASLGGNYPFDRKKAIKDKFDLIRIPCLSDPKLKNAFNNITEKNFNFAFKYGFLLIPGPDESNIFSEWDGCFSPDCQREFRNYLKKEYSSLATLNKSWDTDFKSWDEVVALTSEEVRMKKSFAGWVDHRTFNDINRAEMIERMVNGFKKAAPFAMYSLSGTSETNPHNAWDYYLLMPHLPSLASYTGEQSIQHRSFAPGKLSFMPWIGYDRNFTKLNSFLFEQLMTGASGVNIYGNMNITPDLRISEPGKDLIKTLDIYRNGPAEAVMKMKMFSYPIAFHYSPASIKVDWINNLDTVRKSSVNGFRNIILDAGLNYDYVAYGQLEENGVPSKYKAVVLPCSMAISDKEAAALEKFVADGGVLIADMLAGTYDQHGKKRATPALQKVFGINSTGEWEKNDAEISGSGILKGLKIKANSIEKNITPAGAEVIGKCNGKPAVFLNRYGKGIAIYFASAVTATYGDWKEMRFARGNSATTEAFNKLGNMIFKHANIKPMAKAASLKGANIHLLNNKGAYILGIGRDIEQSSAMNPAPAVHEIKLQKKFYIYDLLKKRYISYGDKFKATFLPDSQFAYVLLPYKVENISINTTPDGAELAVIADTEKFTDHLFRVQLIEPSGKSNKAYDTVVFGNGNKAFFRFKKPLNAVKGIYKLRVTDVLSSVTVEKELK